MIANHDHILTMSEDDPDHPTFSKSKPANLESTFFNSQLRYESSMLINYKLFEAVRLAWVYAKTRPPDHLEAEFKRYGVLKHHWDEWISEENVKTSHSVIIGLQMTGGDALNKEVKQQRNDGGDSIRFGVPG